MEQWAKYVGVSGTLALIFTIAMVAWVSLGVSVPPEVYGFEGAAIGYYFGTNGHIISEELKARAQNATDNTG